MFRPRWTPPHSLAATLLIVGINIACAVLGFTLRVDYGMTVLPTGEVYGLESQGIGAWLSSCAGCATRRRPRIGWRNCRRRLPNCAAGST